MRCLKGEILKSHIMKDPWDVGRSYCELGKIQSVGGSGDEVADLWYQLVEHYTPRSRTDPDDILTAIDALAKDFGKKHGAVLGQYTAGMWQHHLLRGLLWRSDRNQPPPRHQHQHRGYTPTWSWASTPYSIKFNTNPSRYVDWQATTAPTEDQARRYEAYFVPQ